MHRNHRNHYQVLGVSRDASIEEIDRAFKQLARAAHPDLHGGDGAAEERMKELNAIRAELTDPSARAAYDERLAREREAARAASAPPRAPAASAWRPDRSATWMNAAARRGSTGWPHHGTGRAPAREAPLAAGEPLGWDLSRVLWTTAALAAPFVLLGAVGIALKLLMTRR